MCILLKGQNTKERTTNIIPFMTMKTAKMAHAIVTVLCEGPLD